VTVAILFNRLGPYHVARIAAAARAGNVIAIEYSRTDSVYRWNPVGDELAFRRRTLAEDIAALPSRKIWNLVQSALTEEGPDAVAIPGWSGTASLAALHWCLESKVPAVLMSESTRVDEPRYRIREYLKSRLVRLYSAALVGGAPASTICGGTWRVSRRHSGGV
jgi:1,2-diacylglycerol 3-alpha-glucosyltransferase